jgi:hypothetical protein
MVLASPSAILSAAARRTPASFHVKGVKEGAYRSSRPESAAAARLVSASGSVTG